MDVVQMARRVDGNQQEVIQAARQIGAKVQPLSEVGHGCPDLLIAWNGTWYVVEVKDGKKPPSRRQLTPDEKRWHDQFGQQAPICICTGVEDLMRILGVTK